MGIVQKDAFKTMVLSYSGLLLGYLNKGFLFILLFSTEQIGLLNLILSVGLLLAQLSNFGSIYTVWKFFPFFRNQERKNYGFLLLNCLVVFLGLLVVIGVFILLKDQISTLYSEQSMEFIEHYFVSVPIAITTVFFLLFENYLRGLGKNILPVFLNEFLLRLLITLLLVLFAFKFISFIAFLWLFSTIHAVPTMVLLIYLITKKELSLSLSTISIHKRFRKILFSFGVYSYFNSIGAMVVLALDALMIAAILGLGATGVYTTIIYLVSALQIPYRSIIRVCSPMIARFWKERKKDEMSSLYQQVSTISLIISLFLFGLIWFNRNEVFSLLPKEFDEGKWVFLFIMIGRLTDMFFGLNGAILNTSKKYKADLVFTIFLLGVVFVLNLYLIPIFGITGAAISTGVALVVYNLGRVLYVYLRFNLSPFVKEQGCILVLFLFLFLVEELFLVNTNLSVLSIVLKTSLLIVGFILPIYSLKWSADLNAFIHKFTKSVFLKSNK